ncbi:MAG: hypothetical protein Q9213_006415 [Squamulea squamosa]
MDWNQVPAHRVYETHQVVLDSTHVQLNVTDAEQHYQPDRDDNAAPEPVKSPRIIISFLRGDPENPYNWSTVRIN